MQNGLISAIRNKGRRGDTSIAHLTPGEVVVPKEVVNMRPDLMAPIANQVKSMGGNPQTKVVGKGNINPSTGIEEFATEAEVRLASKVQTPRPVVPTYTADQLGNPTAWNVTKDQTVAGNVEKNLQSGSPLNQLSETQGLQLGAQRGILNSSLAVGEAQNSVIKNIMPIATADADVNARAAGYLADQKNQFAKSNVDATNTANQFNAGNKFNAQQTDVNNQFNANQNAADRTLAMQQSLFKANADAAINQINNEFAFDKQSQQNFAGLSDTFNKSLLAINQDTNMNQATKDYAVKQLFDSYKAQISLLSAVGSIPDVSTLLNFGGAEKENDNKSIQKGGGYKGLTIPNNVPTQAFINAVNASDQAHIQKYGMSLFDPRSGYASQKDAFYKGWVDAALNSRGRSV